MTKMRLGTHKYTVLVDHKPLIYFIPLMNPDYLTELDLWDVIDKEEEEEPLIYNKTLFD